MESSSCMRINVWKPLHDFLVAQPLVKCQGLFSGLHDHFSTCFPSISSIDQFFILFIFFPRGGSISEILQFLFPHTVWHLMVSSCWGMERHIEADGFYHGETAPRHTVAHRPPWRPYPSLGIAMLSRSQLCRLGAYQFMHRSANVSRRRLSQSVCLRRPFRWLS